MTTYAQQLAAARALCDAKEQAYYAAVEAARLAQEAARAAEREHEAAEAAYDALSLNEDA